MRAMNEKDAREKQLREIDDSIAAGQQTFSEMSIDAAIKHWQDQTGEKVKNRAAFAVGYACDAAETLQHSLFQLFGHDRTDNADLGDDDSGGEQGQDEDNLVD